MFMSERVIIILRIIIHDIVLCVCGCVIAIYTTKKIPNTKTRRLALLECAFFETFGAPC